MYKYFISYWVIDNDNIPSSGIYSFKFDILKSNSMLRKAEGQVVNQDWGDERDITFISIVKINN